METEEGFVVEWRIENFSHWCAEVHGQCIQSPTFSIGHCANMELYPKGVSGIEEHVMVRFCRVRKVFSCDFSLYCSNGTLLCKQTVSAEGNTPVLDLPPGPKFEDVLSRIRRGSEDFITVRLRMKDMYPFENCMFTTIHVLKVALKISPNGVEKLKSCATKAVLSIHLFPNDYMDQIYLETCGGNDTVHFKITPKTKYEYPFAVEMCVSLTGSDGTVDTCVKKEHVFRDDNLWTFPESLQKKELVGKEISLFLCLKTKDLIQNPSYVIWDKSNVSIQPNNTLCLTESGESSADPAVTSGKDSLAAVVTKDSDSQTSDMPDDSVLSKDLMCLYQDQKFSDLELKCDSVSFPVHRNILSARSPVFDRLLSSDMKEASSGSVDIGDLDPSTLALFLTYLYTGAVEDLESDRALKLYYAADKYQVPSLKGECANFLCDNVSLSNVCDILSVADRHRDDKLISTAHDFILSNYNDALKSKEWESFMCREPLLAVKTLTHFAAKDSVRKHDFN